MFLPIKRQLSLKGVLTSYPPEPKSDWHISRNSFEQNFARASEKFRDAAGNTSSFKQAKQLICCQSH